MEPTVIAGDPWTWEDVAAFLKCSVSTARRQHGIPMVPLEGRTDRDALARFDSNEVRAWWADKVAAARAHRGAPASTPTPRAATTRTRRAPRSAAIRLEVG
jgi:hypothetical protein